eukprot:1311979-Amphidinium_carterae.1
MDRVLHTKYRGSKKKGKKAATKGKKGKAGVDDDAAEVVSAASGISNHTTCSCGKSSPSPQTTKTRDTLRREVPALKVFLSVCNLVHLFHVGPGDVVTNYLCCPQRIDNTVIIDLLSDVTALRCAHVWAQESHPSVVPRLEPHVSRLVVDSLSCLTFNQVAFLAWFGSLVAALRVFNANR